MAKQLYVFHEKNDPFKGFIRFTGMADPTETPDGSTLPERLNELLSKYPDGELVWLPEQDLPNPEAVKWDKSHGTFEPLDPADETPDKKDKLKDDKKKQAIADILPSWGQIQSSVNSAFSDPDQRESILNLYKLVSWLAKNEAG